MYRNTKLYCDRRLGAGLGVAAGAHAGVGRRWLGVGWAGARRAGRVRSAQAGVRGRRWACVGAGRHEGGRARALERSVGSRQQAHGRGARQADTGAQARGARQAGAGRAGLALGCALGALGLFSIRFDSVFFLSHQMNTVHCKIIFSEKKYFKFN